jgi:hypothetical protein
MHILESHPRSVPTHRDRNSLFVAGLSNHTRRCSNEWQKDNLPITPRRSASTERKRAIISEGEYLWVGRGGSEWRWILLAGVLLLALLDSGRMKGRGGLRFIFLLGGGRNERER